MKKFFPILTLLTLPILLAPPAYAQADIVVNADMQKCVSNEDCILVSNSCAQPCGFVPANKATLTILEQTYATKCGKPMDAATTCKVTPPIAAACINSRCTINEAYAHTASEKDYQAGAYAVPEKATPNKVVGDYTKVDDKKGEFSAYNLPQEEVKQKTVGQIITKIYVPADAPVKGEQYVPVAPTSVVPTPAPAVIPAPVVSPPVAVPPTVQNNPVPSASNGNAVSVPPPAASTGPVVQAAPPQPMAVEKPMPMADMPVMKPSRPNQTIDSIKNNPAQNVVAPAPSAPTLGLPETAPSVVPPGAPQAILPETTAPAPQADAAPTLQQNQPVMTDMPSKESALPSPIPTPSTEKKNGQRSFTIKTEKKDSYNLN